MYTHAEKLDYPSVWQINDKVQNNSINIIFGVTAEHKSVYEKLSEVIEGSATTILSKDSSNIVKLVEQEYKVSSLRHRIACFSQAAVANLIDNFKCILFVENIIYH